MVRLYFCRVSNGCRECCKQSIRFTKSAFTAWPWCLRTICRRHRSAVSTFLNVSDDLWRVTCIRPMFCCVHIRASRIYRSRGKCIQVGLLTSRHHFTFFLFPVTVFCWHFGGCNDVTLKSVVGNELNEKLRGLGHLVV